MKANDKVAQMTDQMFSEKLKPTLTLFFHQKKFNCTNYNN